jgi:nucleotide-binding universal stress UspA family protein
MAELDHILTATDLSSTASQAIDRGFLIAKSSGARYTVMHAIGMDALAPLRQFLGENVEAVSQKIVDEARERLAELVAESPTQDSVTADLQVERGLAATAVPAFSESAGVDLVLVGAHGSGFLQRMVLGSTASRLLRKSRCPVLVVKQEAHRAYRRALVTVDFSPGSDATLRIAREVAPGADIVLLHVFEVPFEGKMQYAGVDDEVINQYRIEARVRATHQLRELARSAGLSATDYSGIVVHGDATRHIIEHEERYRCDLVVMGKHGTHVTEELLLGSVTKRVLAESRGDVLVVVDRRHPDPLRINP